MSECMLVGYSGASTVVPGSTRLKCSECETPVWISPSGMRLYAAGARLICERCVPADAEVDAAPGALEELRHALHGHRHRN